MSNDEKRRYLYAFEAAFHKLCTNDRERSRLSMGKWVNAHMYHGMGVSAEEGARRFYEGTRPGRKQRR